MNLYNINTDTLRINSLIIFDTKPIDSTFTHSYYYKKIDQEIAKKRYREKSTKEGSNFAPIPPPQLIEMIINGEKYETTLKLEKSGLLIVETGTGYSKRNPFDKNGDFKRNLKYFTYEQIKVQYIWNGIINLKTN